MSADPVCMEFFPKLMTRAESDMLADRIEEHWMQHGFGLWAVEIPQVMPFAGFVGLNVPHYDAPFMPAVEIGWRLHPAVWGQGFATEGARESLAVAFGPLQMKEIVAITVPMNARSRRVMDKLGMTYDPTADFDHPLLPDGHRFKRHVLYRVKRGRSSAVS